jgi:uracil-DNA glycosylase
MLQRITAANFLPARRTLPALREAAKHCEGCELYQQALQTVFGTGPTNARMMLVGEMPSDEDDLAGEPFVGAAGWLLDASLKDAGTSRDDVYLTNVVKHFRWEPEGKRRMSKKPSPRHITACKPWLEAELELVKPQIIVCLGATPAQFFLGRDFRVTRDRGTIYGEERGPWIMATYHPAAILRVPDRESRERMRRLFVDDLRRALERLGTAATASRTDA